MKKAINSCDGSYGWRKRWLSNQMMTGLGRFFVYKPKVFLSFFTGFKSGIGLPLSSFAIKSVAN
jgi:hypothetical protein